MTRGQGREAEKKKKKKKKNENPKNRINEKGNFFLSHLVERCCWHEFSERPPPSLRLSSLWASPLRFRVMQFRPRRSSVVPLWKEAQRGSRDSSTRWNIVCLHVAGRLVRTNSPGYFTRCLRYIVSSTFVQLSTYPICPVFYRRGWYWTILCFR